MPVNHTLTTVNTKLTLIASNKFINNTAANALGLGSTLTQAISPLVGVPLELEGFTPENSMAVSQQTMAETKPDLRGNLYGGFLATSKIIELNISFVAASESLTTMQTLAEIMSMQEEVMQFNGTMVLTSLQKTFTLSNGYWIDYKSIPTHGRLLEDITCRFRFESAQQTADL